MNDDWDKVVQRVLERFAESDWVPPTNIVWCEQVRANDSDCWEGEEEHVNTREAEPADRSIRDGANVLSAKDMAEILSCDIKTVYEWAKNGQIPVTRLSKGKRKYLFHRDAIAKWLGGKV